jgi:hypothetical protein
MMVLRTSREVSEVSGPSVEAYGAALDQAHDVSNEE